MKKRLVLLAGLGAGFILGSRAGRQSYERLKTQVENLWSDPKVQDGVHRATDAVKDRVGPDVVDRVQSTVQSTADQVRTRAQDLGSKAQDAVKRAQGETVYAEGQAVDEVSEEVTRDQAAAVEDPGAGEDVPVDDTPSAGSSSDDTEAGGEPKH
ncbi:hypothetical protein [Brevibacterium litoralis]|uniref:hypothetical protein n=1 Tax=Brevibacterium litoralis TaxID=3138935 RepID=UPI0032F01B58